MAFTDELRRLIDRLKEIIDLHDLAEKLGLERPGGAGGNYRSPGHKDSSPSLSLFPKDFATGFKDHSDPDKRGDCVALYQYVMGGEAVAAVKALCEMYGIEYTLGKESRSTEPKREKSRAEYIAERCLAQPLKALDYLMKERGISERVARHAIERKAVGWNDFKSTKVEPGKPGHGGDAAAFIVRTLNPGHIVAVDLRYLDPALNGNVKTQCQGEKDGYGWVSDIRRLHSARTVYVVESPINALSLECVIRPDEAAFAIRGVGNVENIDWGWARGKQIIVVFDNDEPFPAFKDDGRPHPQAGIRPGLKAAWALHERLTALDISALLVDQADWEVNDCNDFIKPGGPGMEKLKRAIRKLEQWAIPGLPGNYEDMFGPISGKRRLYLPFHHDQKYWRYRVRPDFTSFVSKIEKDEESEMPKIDLKELAGFRVAGISRVTIQSATSTMTGDADQQPHTMFAITAQTTRHGAKLIRKVVDDEKLHNIETWKRFGPVFDQSNFLRLVNILENAADIGSRKAANFVGLCWKDGALTVNEGPDCYFTNPDQQCPYHSLMFPSGSKADARRVIEAYAATFRRGAALMPLVWALGGHLKPLLGFWPHMQMQADKGAGKSTVIKRLERSISFTMFSGQSLNTEFRQLTSISHTSHPVGWEEISARDQKIIDRAVGLLQENYQFTINRRGSEMTEFLLSAPVLLAGEDVPVDSLIGTLVRTELRQADQGNMMSDDLPRFPVKQWLQFLTEFSPAQVRAVYTEFRDKCLQLSRSTGDDAGATRLAGNYAAILTAWRLLAEFADVDINFDDFLKHVVATMNAHIKETSGDRHPWVWIMQTLLSEIAANTFEAPFIFDYHEQQHCLMVRTSDVMHHMKTRPALRDIWNALPVKSDRVFKRQLTQAEVIVGDVERTIGTKRVAHLAAISLTKLETFGLHAMVPQNKI